MKNFLADSLLSLDSYKNLLDDINKKKKVISLNGILEESLGHFIYSVNFHVQNKKKLVISYTEARAKKIYEDLQNLGHEKTFFFPKKEDFFYNSLARSLDSSNQQIQAMWSLINDDTTLVVTSLEAITNKIMTKDNFDRKSFIIEAADRINIGEISKALINSGYENVYSVEGKGQFSLRGGIIDIFPPISQYPYRIELFDDEIDSIRLFDPISQRSIENVDFVKISPANENLIIKEDAEEIINKLVLELDSTKIKDSQVLNRMNEKFGEIIGKLRDKLFIRNLDLLIPYIKEENLASIVDYLDDNSLIFIDEPRRMEEAYLEKSKDFTNRFSDLLISGEVLFSHQNSFYSYENIVEKIKDKTKITFSNILRDNSYYKPESILTFRMKPITSYGEGWTFLRKK